MMQLVQLQNINVHYSMLAYRELSLKAYAFNLIGLKRNPQLQDIHALKNVTLEINAGDCVALIGHNGAGKSTLLKTIAGLYPVSTGKRLVHGKVRSLFELNLGFESEATGRENILYRGLLLGQRPSQMRQLAAEIIEFADLGKFIDYPIKTYSAGMLVRLAFAISTSIPGDLLLLDEVIGVGDANFMAKARTRIIELVKNAKMMILATHDLHAVRSLCNRVIHIHEGNIVFDGNVEEGIKHYQAGVI